MSFESSLLPLSDGRYRLFGSTIAVEQVGDFQVFTSDDGECMTLTSPGEISHNLVANIHHLQTTGHDLSRLYLTTGRHIVLQLMLDGTLTGGTDPEHTPSGVIIIRRAWIGGFIADVVIRPGVYGVSLAI